MDAGTLGVVAIAIILAAVVIHFRPRAPRRTLDGTVCGSREAHRWKYVHESCDGSQSVRCVNEGCKLQGWLPFMAKDDCAMYDIAGGYILYPGYNDDVHYEPPSGTCLRCAEQEHP